jgi:hypothetical protein
MKRILLIALATIFTIPVVFLKLAPVLVAGQTATPKAAAASGPPIKTPWGEPDLQGIWTDEFQIPLQRPAKYANQEFFTDAQRAALDKSRAAKLDHDYRAERGTENDVAGAYNAVYHLRKRTGRRTSLIVDPPDGRMPAYTDAVKKRQAIWRDFYVAMIQATSACQKQEPECRGGKFGPPSPRLAEVAPFYPWQLVDRSDGPEDRGLGERCLAGFNIEFGNVNGFSRRIVQTPGDISIYYDSGQGQGWQRNIVMNGTPHLPANVRQWWGDSRGHWEGNTLVIDVTNFTPKTANFEARENLHLVERFTRLDPKTLEYSVTIEDPTTWVRPWTVKQEYSKQSDEQNRIYTEPRCHEGNYGLSALLHGARAVDQAFAEGRGPDPATVYIANTSAEKVGADEEETRCDFDN